VKGFRLHTLLALLLGSEGEAADMLEEALDRAGHRRLPEDPEALDEFVRDYVLERFTAATGPRLAAMMLAELRTSLGLGKDRPSSSTTRTSLSFQRVTSNVGAVREWASTIAVFDSDPQRRRALARLLVQGGAVAPTFETLAEVDVRESFDTAIVRVAGPVDVRALTRIAGASRGSRFVAVAQLPVDAAAFRGNAAIEVVPAETPLAGIAAMALANVDACA